MKIFFQNVRGANTKQAVVCLWYNYLDRNLVPSCYQQYQGVSIPDRNRNLKWWWIIVGVRAGYKSKQLSVFDSPDLDMVWLRVQISTVHLLYRNSFGTYIHQLLKSFPGQRGADFRVWRQNHLARRLQPLNERTFNGSSMSPSNYINDDPVNVNGDFVQTTSCFDLSQFNTVLNANGRFLDLMPSDIESSKISCVQTEIILSDRIDVQHPPQQFDSNMP